MLHGISPNIAPPKISLHLRSHSSSHPYLEVKWNLLVTLFPNTILENLFRDKFNLNERCYDKMKDLSLMFPYPV